MRLTALLPLACSIVAFVLTFLCVFAGSKPGFMEDYHIISLNTSTLGHNLINTTKTTSSPTTQPTTVWSWLTGTLDNITDTVLQDLQDAENDIADKLAATLGIKQWYSLHLMDMCEGMYAPNATSSGAWLNTTNCTAQTAMFHFDPTTQIDNELHAGLLHTNISAIAWSSSIQDGIAALNGVMDATFIFYILGIAFSGLAILLALLAFLLHGSRLVSLLNWALAFVAFLCLAIASVLVTVLMLEATKTINEHGNGIGVYAYKGSGFLALTWSAAAVMLLACLTWIAEICLRTRQQRREYTEKPAYTWTGRQRSVEKGGDGGVGGGGGSGSARQQRISNESTLRGNSWEVRA